MFLVNLVSGVFLACLLFGEIRRTVKEQVESNSTYDTPVDGYSTCGAIRRRLRASGTGSRNLEGVESPPQRDLAEEVRMAGKLEET